MEVKQVILSAAGLKNLVNDKKDFLFIFGDCQILMNSVYAEFISPNVSHLHQVDPTIRSIEIRNSKMPGNDAFTKIFTEDIITLFQEISCGSEISINEEQSSKMRLISMAIGNNELLNKINNLYPINRTNSDQFLQHFQELSQSLNNSDSILSSTTGIDIIAQNFFTYDQSNLLKLPKTTLYSIISNPNLKIENEDSLFDFICKIFENDLDTNDESPKITSFLEEIYIVNLSKEKFHTFLELVEPNEISISLWRNLCQRFSEPDENNSDINNKRYTTFIESDSKIINDKSIFTGIISNLTKQSGGNVAKNGTIFVTSSSEYSSDYSAQNVVDLDSSSMFSSRNERDQWLMYDFRFLRIKPTSYYIKSGIYGKYEYHPRSWDLEGSNNGKEWDVLDSRRNDGSLNGVSSTGKFDISSSYKYYKYLRIKQTDTNWKGDNFLVISALEFDGSIQKFNLV